MRDLPRVSLPESSGLRPGRRLERAFAFFGPPDSLVNLPGYFQHSREDSPADICDVDFYPESAVERREVAVCQ